MSAKIKLVIVIGLWSIAFFNSMHAQQPFSITIERFKNNGNKNDLMNEAFLWMLSDPEFQIEGLDSLRGVIKACGSFYYQNKVVLEMVFLSPRIGEKTSGVINYDIYVTLTDTSYKIDFTNFYHISDIDSSRYSFGRIPQNPEPFNRQCSEHSDWCKLVWMDITKTAKIKTRMKWIKVNW